MAGLLDDNSFLGQFRRGATAIPGTVRDYFRDRSLSQIGADAKTFGGLLYEGAKNDPVGFALDMTPVIGEIRSGLEARELGQKARTAREGGDDRAASNYEQLMAVAAAGAAPLAGMAARGARRGAKAAKEAAPQGLLADGPPPAPPTLPGETRVSTRFPTAKKATEDPINQQLTIGLDEMRRSSTFDHNMSLIPEYPGFARLQGLPAEEIAQQYIRQTSDNMNFIYDNSPAILQQRSPLWYDGANEFAGALAQRYGIPRPSASGAIAAMSPQKDWFMNASLAERAGDIMFGPSASRRMTPDMEDYQRSSSTFNKPANLDIFRRIQGKRLSELTDPLEQAMWVRLYDEAHNPRSYRDIAPEGLLGNFVTNLDGTPSKIAWGSGNEIAKAIQSFNSGGDMRIISPLLGDKNKVRSFYNNIELPNDRRFGDTTIDTHQVAAGQMRALSGNTPAVAHNFGSSLDRDFQPPGYRAARNSSIDGVQGTYGLLADATRMSAVKRGMPYARSMQSAPWEAVRELFTEGFKNNPASVQRVDDIWRAYDAGQISIDQARRAILDFAGGIGTPQWASSGASYASPFRASTYR
jgi:hypothetical protein